MVTVRAWDRMGLDHRKVLAFCSVSAVAAGAAVRLPTVTVLQGDSLLLSLLVAAVAFYLAATLPRRLEGAAALAQAREAPALAVMGSAILEATHSTTRAILLLRSSDEIVSSTLLDVRRRVLLGHPAEVAVAQAGRLASGSANEVLGSIAAPEHPRITEEGEEARGISDSSRMADESKLPLFTAVAFFAPIMLVLYAIMGHVTDPFGLAELVGLQVVLLDIAFYFSSSNTRSAR
jgi:hypothetical protein